MSRRTKFCFIAGFPILGAITIAFFAERFRGDVKVEFVGAATNGSPLTSFFITNSSRSPIVYSLEGQTEANGLWPSDRLNYSGPTFRYSNYTGKILGRAGETITVKYDGAKRWRIFVLYRDSWNTSALGRTHAKLAREASRLGWKRLSQWIKPKPGFERVSSPIMLGNAPEASSPP